MAVRAVYQTESQSKPSVVLDNLIEEKGPKAASPLAVPSVLDRGELSEVQQAVLDFLKVTPGATIQRIATHFGVAHATASYHLNTLRRLELLAQEREGREVRHYALSEELSAAQRLHPLLTDSRRRGILVFLGTQRPQQFTVNQIADRVGVNHGFLMRTLDQLVRLGFVQVHRRGIRYVVEPSAEFSRQLSEALASSGPLA